MMINISGIFQLSSMKNNQVSNTRLYITVLALAAIIAISLGHSGIMKAYGQSMTAKAPGMNNTTTQRQHAAHILDNLIISEHIPLTGQLTSGDYMLLMDFTPFATSVEGHSHIAM